MDFKVKSVASTAKRKHGKWHGRGPKSMATMASVQGTGIKDAKCFGCPLYFAPGPLPGAGPMSSPLWFVGEAPYRDEMRQKKPFAGGLGKIARFAMKSAGVRSSKVHITYAVRCTPTRHGGIARAATDDEYRYCMERFLWPELAEA